MKAIFKTLDAIPEPLRATATKRDDNTYLLDFAGADPEGYVEKARLDEFRENNVRLMQERETLTATIKQFEGIDPAKAREAAKKLQELEDKKMIDEGKVDELLAQRTQRMREEFDASTAALKGSVADREQRANTLAEELTKLRIEDAIKSGAISRKVLSTAVKDAVSEGRSIFKLKPDGKTIEAFKPDGTQWYGKDGTNFITIDEWLADVAPQTSPHWFGPSSGQDLLGNTGARVGAGVITLTQEQAQDVETYRTARARADKEGLKIAVSG